MVPITDTFHFGLGIICEKLKNLKDPGNCITII